MPTNDERREVAARLRGMAVRTNPSWPALMEALGTPGRSVTVMYLADLIEPEERTCHLECVKSGPFYDVFRFDCCGKEYSESRMDDGATELPLAVCPFCGAKVIQE